MNPNCPACDAPSLEEEQLPQARLLALYRQVGPIAQHEEALFDDYRLMRCTQCDLRFADPMRPGSAAFYDWAYRRAPYDESARWEWGTVVADLARLPPGPFLDIGCGKGGLLALVQATGRPALGIERNEVALQHCRRIGVRAEPRSVEELLADPAHTSIYAAVSLSHVLEHLADPLAVLRQAAALLQPGGRLYVAVPFSPQFWESEGYDPFNLPPHHLTRWNASSMRGLAEAAGLAVTLRCAPAPGLLHMVWIMWSLRLRSAPTARREMLRKVLRHPLKAAAVAARVLRFRRTRFDGAMAGHVMLAAFAGDRSKIP
jgi:SAM-dependent methyltransferase